LPVECIYVIGKSGILTRLLIDVAGDCVALLRHPGLLVTGSAAVVFGKWCGRARLLGVVGFEIPFVDTPPSPCRDVGVVGLHRVLLESPIDRKVAGVLPKDHSLRFLKIGSRSASSGTT
jgi:hypothetical protein